MLMEKGISEFGKKNCKSTDMKILMVVPWFPTLNADTLESQQGIFEYRQVKELVERGSEFRIISIRWRGQSNCEVIGEKVEVYRIPPIFVFPKIRYPVPRFIALSRKIEQVCTNWNPDIIIYNHMIYLTTLPIFWLKNKLNVPSIVTTDAFPGISWFYGNKIVDFVGYLYSRLVAKKILKLADGIQLMTVQLLADTKRMNLNLDNSTIFVCSRGVDTELFEPRNDKSGLRKELGIEEDEIVVLYVGRLDLVKGVNYLLQAAKRILTNHDNIKFLIVGEGSLRQKYERFAKNLFQGIIFTGWRSDVSKLMNIANIFILPSLSEGTANVVMEASASGLPVIATEVGEVPRIVSNSETGILVKPKDVDRLVEAIERLIENPLAAENMGERGRRRIEESYGWEIICDKLEGAYRETIERFNRASQQ